MNLYFRKCRRDQGYVLLVLLLIVSLLSIGVLAMIERVDFQIKRDREEEFIHRGVEYSRAVRKYVKKFGRYPTSVEALENSNGIRFLRKRYKDPLTGKDFKFLYYGDVSSFNQQIAKAPAVSTPAVQNHPAIPNASASDVQAAETSPTGEAESPSANDSSGSAEAVQSKENSENDSNPSEAATDQPSGEATSEIPGADTGGRAIVGVTSYSKAQTIRIFNNKNHYNQWQFIYDPSTDAGLTKTPDQPLLNGARQVQQAQNEPGSTSNPGMNLPGQR